jgi:LacI family transcriptional regulator
MNDTSPPTLQDIADRMGLAKSTVSLALRNKGTLSEKTRVRIKQTAEDMGYRPDPLLAALVNRRNKAPANQLPVAFLSNDDTMLHHSYFEACGVRAEEWGYRMEHRVVESEKDMPRTLRELWHRGTPGLILHHIPPGEWLESELLRDFAVVQCRLHRQPLPFTTVRSDLVRKTHATVEHMLTEGHRRIGNAVMLTTSDRSHQEDQDRMGGVLSAQSRFGNDAFFAEPLWIDLTQKNEAHWRKTARNWVTSEKLDAVICTTDGLADLLFYGWKKQPAIFSTLLDSGRKHQRYPGMADNTALIGEKCLELIDQFVRTRRFGIPVHPYDVVIPSTWSEADPSD